MYNNILRFQDSFLHNFGGTELVASNQQVYFGTKFGEIRSLLSCCIPAADYSNFQSAEEEPIANGTG